MYIKTILNDQDCKKIANKLKIEFQMNHFRKTKDGKNVISFRLFPISDKFRIFRNNRRINAVCFHGYTLFMIELKSIDPDIQFKSTLTRNKWTDQIDLSIGEKNIGSIISPLKYENACKCDDSIRDKVIKWNLTQK